MLIFLIILGFLVILAGIIVPAYVDCVLKEKQKQRLERCPYSFAYAGGNASEEERCLKCPYRSSNYQYVYCRLEEKQHSEHCPYRTKPKKLSKLWTILLVFFGLFLFIMGHSITVVPTGYSGVRTTFGQINQTTVQNGVNLKLPFVQKIELVNNKQREALYGQNQIWSETESRTALYYEDITVTYQISPERSSWLFANVNNYTDAVMTEAIVASAVKSSSKTLSDTDATNRSIIEPMVQEEIQKSVDQKFGEGTVLVNKVTISGVDFEESYNQAIAEKQQAQLKAEQQKIENEKAIAKAEADAQVKKTTAQAEADAILIEAEANAKANELMEKSITENILRQQYVEKWNGKLPNVVAGEDASTLVLQPSDAAEGENTN